jgi:5'(3')-deoxyribonucleotidase
MKNIYLDMDGVCSNFIKSCILANNLNYNETINLWISKYKGEFSAYKVFNITNNEFWKNIEKAGEEFWSEMEVYPWFNELYTELSKLGKVIFLTSPSQSPTSLSGKLKWLHKEFNSGFKDYIITPQKHLLANKDSVLIDDFPQNIESFIGSGGNGILFPQFWNSKDDVDDKVKYILDRL